jgi:predicted AAA+ superfamily ATPase
MLSDYKDIRELRDVILLLVPRAGNILDITRLASELKITRLKLYGYIEFLQGVFFIRLISKFTANIDRSVAGGKKIYFSDSGLLNVIGKVSEGQLFENTLANQLSEYGELTFYNKQSRAEIDFILNKEIAFEAKRTPTQRDLKKLERLSSSLGLKEHYLISPKYSTVERTIYPMFL